MSSQELNNTLREMINMIEKLRVSVEQITASQVALSRNLQEIDPSDSTIRLTPTDEYGRVHLIRSPASSITMPPTTWQLSAMPGKERSKAFGIVFLGGGREPICAKSGWGFPKENNGPLPLIDCGEYTDRTIALCKAVGFHLEAHENDGEINGRFHASFASMQLITRLAEMKRPDLFDAATPEVPSSSGNESIKENANSSDEEASFHRALLLTNVPLETDMHNHCPRYAAHIGKLLGVQIYMEHRR